MADNENQPPEKQKPEKKLLLDLSEAMAQGFEEEDEDDIIELKDEVIVPAQETEPDLDSEAQAAEENEQSGLPPVEQIINLDEFDEETGELENVIPITDDLTFEEEDEKDDFAAIAPEEGKKDDTSAEIAPLGEEDEGDISETIVPLEEEDEGDISETIVALEEEDEGDDLETIVPLDEEDEGDDLKAIVALEEEDEGDISETIVALEEEDEGDISETIVALEEEDDEYAGIVPIEQTPVLKADDHDEIEEITEFEDILSDDANEMVTLSEISEEIEPEDEFLELIDVEEDSEDELDEIEDDLIRFNGPGADIEDVELKDFINDSVDEEIRIDDDFEDDLARTLGVEATPEIKLGDQEPPEEEFDMNMDSREISEKIDQLETIFFDETQAEDESDENELFDAEALAAFESDIVDRSIEKDTMDEVDSKIESPDVPLAAGGMAALDADPEEIEKSIERIIERNYADKIESMITRIIENAVSKEIKRLKSKLLEDDRDEDF